MIDLFPTVPPEQRVRPSNVKKPLRTITELSEELGVSRLSLAKLIQHRGGPKAKMKTGRNTWYDPVEVRRWYKEAVSK